ARIFCCRTGIPPPRRGQMSIEVIAHAIAPAGETVMSPYRPLALVAAIALLGGCATIPQPLRGTYSSVSTAAAQQGGAGGTHVRWGGEIIKTEPGPQQTCFYLLSRPLNDQARPTAGDESEREGRLISYLSCTLVSLAT